MECEICNYEGDKIEITETQDERIKRISCSKCGYLKEVQRWKKEFF
jgi:hypothetical protein